MITLFKKLIANRNLLKNLVIRDLKHRYVGSIGGFLWSVIHPLLSRDLRQCAADHKDHHPAGDPSDFHYDFEFRSPLDRACDSACSNADVRQHPSLCSLDHFVYRNDLNAGSRIGLDCCRTPCLCERHNPGFADPDVSLVLVYAGPLSSQPPTTGNSALCRIEPDGHYRHRLSQFAASPCPTRFCQSRGGTCREHSYIRGWSGSISAGK